MKRLVALLLIMSSFSISEQLTFFVQVPSSRNWMMGNPFLVEIMMEFDTRCRMLVVMAGLVIRGKLTQCRKKYLFIRQRIVC